MHAGVNFIEEGLIWVMELQGCASAVGAAAKEATAGETLIRQIDSANAAVAKVQATAAEAKVLTPQQIKFLKRQHREQHSSSATVANARGQARSSFSCCF